MSNSIHEFDRLMLDYLKGDITPEDRQRMTELLHKDASCREKYREMSRAYAIASVPWFERRKKQNLDFLREKLDLRSSPGRTLVRRVRVGSFAAMVALLIGLGIRFIYLNNHPAAGLAVFLFGEFAVVVLDVVFLVIVLNGGLDGLLGQNGAVQLVRGQAAQRVDDLLIGQRQRVLQRPALDHLRRDGA